MRIFLILLGLCLILAPLHLLDQIAESTFFLQSFCSKLFMASSVHGNLASAFICGTPINENRQQQIFTQTGLIHLMVVSGAHLVFVMQVIHLMTSFSHRSRNSVSVILILLLSFYGLMTGFQAPVVRSLAGLILQKVSHYFRWNWDPLRCQLNASLWVLLLNPSWICNFSFYLSCLAGCGLNWGALVPCDSRWGRHLYTCLAMQVLMSTALSSLSWLTLLMNILVAPAVSPFLFPLCLVGLFFPFLRPLVDWCWEAFLALLDKSIDLSSTPSPEHFQPPSFSMLSWIFLAALMSALYFLRRTRHE